MPKAHRLPDHPATQMLAVIGQMYAVEARWRERPVIIDESSEQACAIRYQMRQEYSAPLIERLQVLLLAHLHGVLPQSLLGKALHYLHGQWRKLIRYVDDGRYPIDNNACENAIRPFVLGRKNWMFCDSVGGAKASANLYSLIKTAKANGIEPYRYLCQLFQALPAAKGVDDYEALLPWNIARGPP